MIQQHHQCPQQFRHRIHRQVHAILKKKNDLQDFSQTLVDSTSVFLDQDQYTVFEKAQKMDYALWGQSSNLKGLNFKIEDAPTFVPMTQNAPTYVKLNGHDYEVYQNSYKEFEEYMKSIFYK